MNDNSAIDWAKFYQDLLKQIKIPSTNRESYGRTQVIIRGLIVNLGDVLAEIRRQGLQPKTVSIYADVVKLPKDLNWVIADTGLLIVSRMIEVEPGAIFLLDYRNSRVGKLVLYTQEIGGVLQAKVVTSTAKDAIPTILDLAPSEAIGMMVSYKENAVVKTGLTSFDDSSLNLGSPARMLLGSLFQVATVVYQTHPDVARSMLTWITSMTRGSRTAQVFYLQGAAFLAQVNSWSNEFTFVPYLDKDVYDSASRSFLEAAKAYETQYARFSDRKQSISDRIDAANLMLQQYQDAVDYNEKLIRQAEENLQGARQAAGQAEQSLKIQQSKATEAGIGFKYDSKIWQREQVLNAVMQMCFAVVTFAAAIGLMAVGDEAAGASAAGAVAEGAQAAKKAEEVAQEVKEVSTLAQTMNGLTEAMRKLKGVSDNLQTMYESITTIVAASQKIAEVTHLPDVTIPYTDNISAQAEWDAFRLDVERMFKPAIDQGIPGALEYQVELDKLSVFGKAYMASQVAVVQAGQELARLYLQRQMDTNQLERLQQQINNLSVEVEADDEVMQMLFERQLNIKRWLFITLQNYISAYRYWALQESRVQLSIVKPVDELQDDLATVTEEWAEALESFNPPPQAFPRITLTIPETEQGKYKGVIANLCQNRSATFAIETTDPIFDGLDRVRLSTVRVWLEGVTALPETPLHIDIKTSGVYADRFYGKPYLFTSPALDQVFKYDGEAGNERSILIDGRVDDRDRYLYFQPTPFTQWTITVPEHYNSGIDLSTLKSIKIEFAGSVNAQPSVIEEIAA